MKHCALILLIAAGTFAGNAIAQTKTGKPIIKTNQKMTGQKMKVEVWSDVVCPFCYLGKRRYEAALKQFADAANVELVWRSFQLYPGLQQTIKENSYEHIAKMKGISHAQSVQMHQNVVNMAKEDGLHYHFDKTIVANSYNAHRLLQMAKKHHLGSEAEEQLFKAYLVDGKNINDNGTLVKIGTGIGLDAGAVQQMLVSNEFAAEVDADIKEAQQLGINGVPFFVFNRKYAVSGAQPVDTFLQTLKHAFSEWRQLKN